MPKLKPETVAKRQAIKNAKLVTDKLNQAIKQLDNLINNKGEK